MTRYIVRIAMAKSLLVGLEARRVGFGRTALAVTAGLGITRECNHDGLSVELTGRKGVQLIDREGEKQRDVL